MRFIVLTSVLSLVASCFAFIVVTPNASNGWTNQGPQNVSWQRNNTDALYFTIILTNQNRTLLPSDQTLAPQLDSTLLSTTLPPPDGGWPTPGAAYQLNFVLGEHYPMDIFVQSGEFTISQSGYTNLSSSATSSLSALPSSLSTPSSALPHSSSSPALSSSSPTSAVQQTSSSSKQQLHNVAITLVCTVISLCFV